MSRTWRLHGLIVVGIMASCCGAVQADTPEKSPLGVVEPPDTSASDSTFTGSALDTLFKAARDSSRIRRDLLRPDSLVIDVPPTFQPWAPRGRPALRSEPGMKADSLFGASVIDVFLLPPEGPAVILDRTDLRLTGPAEWWEVMGDIPGVFTLPPGYPGAVTPISFHAHGPGGTLVAYGGRPLHGGLAPIENPNPVSKSALTGAAVMRTAASHLYGPGAGGGALLFIPIAQAPDRAYAEITNMTGIFGQKGGSVTASTRWGRLGAVFDYGGSGADFWSAFESHDAERYAGRVDWVRGPIRVSVAGRVRDERFRGFLGKRVDDGREGELSVERRIGETGFASMRLTQHRSTIKAIGDLGPTYRTLRRKGGELLLSQTSTDGTGIGILAGHYWEDFRRLGLDPWICTHEETSTFVLVRAKRTVMGVRADASVRYDRLVAGQSVLAPGVTLSRDLYPGSTAWLHVARTADRIDYFHRINDFYSQVDQGIDLPRTSRQPIPTGISGSLGWKHRTGRLRAELAAVADRGDVLLPSSPETHTRPLRCGEPVGYEEETVRSVGGWGALEVGPIGLGRFIGHVWLGASGYVGSTPEERGRQLEPWRYGEIHGRLKKTFFQGDLRLEGFLRGEFLGEMRSPLGRLVPQTQWIGGVNAQIRDVLLFYRVENIFSTSFLSSAWDFEVGFVPITRQNIVFGFSWVLLD